VTLLSLPHRPAKRPPRFFRIATLLNRLGNMGFELLLDLTVQAIRSKHIVDARPQRHFTPSSKRDSLP
jgi:hypothetical protein